MRRGYQIESDFANTIAGASKAWWSRVAKRSLTPRPYTKTSAHFVSLTLIRRGLSWRHLI